MPKTPEKAQSRLSEHQLKTLTVKPFILIRYAKQLQTLFLSLPFYLGVYWHLRYISPEHIRHILIPNSYLPFQVYLFLGNFFLLSFLFLNVRRGFLVSLGFALSLFFQLQTLLTWQVLVIICLPLLILEIISSLLDR